MPFPTLPENVASAGRLIARIRLEGNYEDSRSVLSTELYVYVVSKEANVLIFLDFQLSAGNPDSSPPAFSAEEICVAKAVETINTIVANARRVFSATVSEGEILDDTDEGKEFADLFLSTHLEVSDEQGGKIAWVRSF